MLLFNLIIDHDMDSSGRNKNTNFDASLPDKKKNKKRKMHKRDKLNVPHEINHSSENDEVKLISNDINEKMSIENASENVNNRISDEIFVQKNRKLINFMIKNCNNEDYYIISGDPFLPHCERETESKGKSEYISACIQGKILNNSIGDQINETMYNNIINKSINNPFNNLENINSMNSNSNYAKRRLY